MLPQTITKKIQHLFESALLKNSPNEWDDLISCVDSYIADTEIFPKVTDSDKFILKVVSDACKMNYAASVMTYNKKREQH